MNKFSKKYIYYHLLTDFAYSFFVTMVLFINIFTDEEGEIIVNPTITLIVVMIWIAMYLIMMVYHILFYNTASYEFTDKGIVCTRGVLFKKKSFLEYKKIHTVNKKQNIPQQLFKVGSLLIDSGATKNAYNAEINIFEDVNKIDELMNKIKLYQESDTIPSINDQQQSIEEIETQTIVKENLYNFTSKRKFLYSVLTTVGTLFVTTIILILAIIIIPILMKISQETEYGLIDVLIYGIIIYIIFTATSFISSLLFSFITYYDFKIYKNKNALEISYGLLNKNNNTFHLDRLKAIKVNQGLIKRIFGFASIDIEVIGYGEINNDNKAQTRSILIPLCKKSEVNLYIKELFGEQYIPGVKEEKAKAFFPLISWKILTTLIIMLIPIALSVAPLLYLKEYVAFIVVLCSCLSVFIVFSLIFIINALFKYRNEGISVNDRNITIYHGGINQVTTIFLKRHIIAIEDLTTPLQSKKSIYTYIIHFRSNALTNETIVEIIDEKVREKLINSVRF